VKASHKTRLFLISAVSAGSVLAIVFLFIVLGVRQKVLAHKESEIRLALRTDASIKNGQFSIEGFREAYPGYSAAIFDANDHLLTASGPSPLRPAQGFQQFGDYALLGDTIGGQHIVVSSGWTPAEHGLDDLAAILAWLWLPLTLLVGTATWIGAQSVFRPLERLTLQAAAISGSNLKARLASQDQAEFGVFATQLNQMLDRIEQTVAREEEFATDAAHELRTPLAILRMQIQTTLLAERPVSEYVASNRVLLDEIQRLSSIAESLLQSARGTAVRADPIDLVEVAHETVQRMRQAYDGRASYIQFRSEPVWAKILPDELRVVLDNLLRNAIRFSPPQSPIEVTVERQGEEAVLSVRDEGPGIPPELRAKVFDRFFRAETSRNRGAGGAGVGLAVCKRIVESRGGVIKVDDATSGTRIVLRLPCS
jgi:two-component system OmpR family sensor kinase